MGRTSREIWAKRVARWKDSGLTATAFATQVGISANSLSWWKWRLGSEVRSPAAKPRRPTRSAPGSPAVTKQVTLSPLTFVEMAAPIATDALEVVMASTVFVRVHPGFDEATLGRLLDVLERRR
jgi:transposase